MAETRLISQLLPADDLQDTDMLEIERTTRGSLRITAAMLVTRTRYATDKQAQDEKIENAVGNAVYKFAQIPGAASITIPFATSGVHRVTLTAATTTIAVNSTLKAGEARQITIILRQGVGAQKVNWPANIKWPNDRPPVLSLEQGQEDFVTLLSCATDSHIYGFSNGGTFNV